jgi:hypothetical protein
MEDDIFTKINSGEYDNKLPYRTKKENEQIWKAYHEESIVLYEMFKNDLFKYYGVENNPKKDLLFSKAWEFGHSSGYNEVAIYFGDLVELIRR